MGYTHTARKGIHCCQGLPSSYALTSKKRTTFEAGTIYVYIYCLTSGALLETPTKDKSSLTFAAWSPRQGFTEQGQPNITIQPYCPAQTAVNRGASEHPAQSTSSQTPSCPAPGCTALAAEVTCVLCTIHQPATNRLNLLFR